MVLAQDVVIGFLETDMKLELGMGLEGGEGAADIAKGPREN